MILVDTSVWIDHLRRAESALGSVLENGLAMCHPFVIGELACGRLRERARIIDMWSKLPAAPVAMHDEALTFVSRHALAGRGIGWLDVHLLASTALAGGAKLWTYDKRLADVAADLGIGYSTGAF